MVIKPFAVSAAVLLSALGLHGNAHAWGPHGHAMIADMAELHLQDGPKTEVARLLKIEGAQHLDDISSWADDDRHKEPETGAWHFVDIPLDAASYDESRDCHSDEKGQHVDDANCVVAKLPYYAKVLADKTKSDQDRLIALKWVVHLAGDIHQPLHAENHADRGGNDVHVSYYGASTNLHAVWDGGIIEHQYSWKLGPNFSFDHKAVQAASKKLDTSITAAQRSAWAPAGLLTDLATHTPQWANDTHGLAPTAYKKLPASKPHGWENAYQSYAWPVVSKQLSIASVRLSEILNEALK